MSPASFVATAGRSAIVTLLTLGIGALFSAPVAPALAGTTRTAPRAIATTCCPVVELRQYVTVPGKRDALIHLFENHFIESQESAGILLPGQFKVPGDPDAFDWLQGFSSMQARLKSFNAFYYGPAWRKYRKLANSFLLDVGNVLLLQPAHAGSGFPQPSAPRPLGSTIEPRGLLVVTIYHLGSNSAARFDRIFETAIRPVVQAHGSRVIATFVTDRSPNNFPILPVRTNVNEFVWFACYAGEAAYDSYESALAADPRWWSIEGNFALAQMYVPPEVHRLLPTPRSALRCEQRPAAR